MCKAAMIFLMIGLLFLNLKSEAQNSFDFQYSYQDVYSPNALDYVVQQQNITRTTEGNGISYWNPINNGTTAILTQEFTFARPTTEIYLYAHIAAFNFYGNEYGSGSLWASTDDINWVMLANAPTPPDGTLQANSVYNADLPSYLLGANQIYIQTQLNTSGWNILAQFQREDPNSPITDPFTLNANLIPVPECSSMSFFGLGITILALLLWRKEKADNKLKEIRRCGKIAMILLIMRVFLNFKSEAQPLCLTNGLVAYYPFNGNVNDASGNGNNGTNYGTVLTTNRFGNANSAYSFNGSSYIALGPIITNYNVMSMSAWICTTQTQGGEGAIVSKPSTASITGSRLGMTDRYDTGTGNSLDSGFYVSNGVINMVVETTNINNNGMWHQGVYVNNGTNVQLFVDGKLIGSTSYSPGNYTSSQPMSIGREWPVYNNVNGFGFRYFTGIIDDVRIYNRALSPSEVAQLYSFESSFLGIQQAVYLNTYYLSVGSGYQLQISGDLINWTNYGAAFIATNTYWQSSNYWSLQGGTQLFFRLLPQ